jgi:multidrug/hemolysin transport system permease protein
MFLRDMNIQNFKQYFGDVETDQMRRLSDSLMLANAVSIGAVTVAMTALGVMVSDKDKKITMDFMVAPISKNILVASYFLSSFIICLIICAAFVLAGGMLLLSLYGVFFSALQILFIFLSTALALVFGNIFMIFILSFFKKETALGGLGTIIGTLIGFISGAYVPMNMFSDLIRNTILCLPFAQIAAILKNAFLYDVNKSIGLSAEMFEKFLYDNGVKVSAFNVNLSLFVLILVIVGYIVLFSLLSTLRYRKLQNK